MSVSVIVSNFNGLKYLPRLVESLRAQRGVEMEIIFVDRQSTDGSIDYIQSFPGVLLTMEPPETGLVAGYHAGSKIASKENLFFCNEDMWFEPDCLALLEKNLNPSLGVIATDPWQWNYEGNERIHAGTRFQQSRFCVNSAHPFYSPNFDCDLPVGSVVPFPCAGAFLITAQCYRDLGGWDTSFFLNHEDIDLFIRAWQQNYKCVTVPQAKVYHACGASNGKAIQKGKLSVGKRRYVSSLASLVIIGLKYFSLFPLFLNFLSMGLRVGGNLLRGRFRYFRWDFLVLSEIIRRAPAAVRFRKENQRWNRLKTGESFFSGSEFRR